MAATVRADERGAKGVRRIVRSQAKKAIEELEKAPPADGAIHDARKRIKKVRAGLRLLRDAFGSSEYRRENAAFRHAGRLLSAVRDAKILIEMLDEVARNAAPSDRKAVEQMRGKLEQRRATARRRLVGRRQSLEPVVEELQSARKSIAKVEGRSGWSTLGPGQRRVYRAGRSALARTIERPTDENFHELRKQAKYLYLGLRMLAPVNAGPIRALVPRVKRLSDHLGRDHDLAVLRNTISRMGVVRRPAARSVMGDIDREREKLQEQALALAGAVYAEAPRQFSEALGRYWRARRSKRPDRRRRRAQSP